ncbi:hypothetical protein DMUE_2602 [Dictyocoela muelleri]|nr:hypothetical protein DMUE_2602 [Dictyocoela muelleri]
MKVKDRFYILNGLNFEFLLGMEFIIKNNVILDMKNNSITIDGSEYELDIPKNKLPAYDEQLTEKTKIYQTVTENSQLKGLILSYKQKNPKIGEISNVKHEITLCGQFVLPKCDYGVPIAIQNDVKNHLMELEK